MLWLFSCLCLCITALMCIAGVLSSNFDDSLLQRAGLAILCFFCFGRAAWLWHVREVNTEWFGMHLGMALFAVGTGLKFYGLFAQKRRHDFIERRQQPW